MTSSINIRVASISDVENIYEILTPHVKKNIIIERTREEIAKNINFFFIALTNGAVSGVISYYDYGESLKEIRSLAVKEDNLSKGVGSALVNYIVNYLSNEYPLATIFVLTYVPKFFKKQGFSKVSKAALPEKIWKDCDHCPNRENCTETAMIYTKAQ